MSSNKITMGRSEWIPSGQGTSIKGKKPKWKQAIIDYLETLPDNPDEVKFLRDEDTKLVDCGDGYQTIKQADIKVIEIWYRV